MTSFREQLYIEAEEILLNQKSDPKSGKVLRELWQCSKHGNLLVDLVDDLLLDGRHEIERIIHMPGFLNKHEQWHSSRASKKQITVYRGCDRTELDGDELGISWSLSKEIANFFASRRSCGDPVIVTAHACIDAWLDTEEHECILLFPHDFYRPQLRVVNVEKPTATSTIDWNDRPRLRPTKRPAA